jgi:hypothetical protein
MDFDSNRLAGQGDGADRAPHHTDIASIPGPADTAACACQAGEAENEVPIFSLFLKI